MSEFKGFSSVIAASRICPCPRFAAAHVGAIDGTNGRNTKGKDIMTSYLNGRELLFALAGALTVHSSLFALALG